MSEYARKLSAVEIAALAKAHADAYDYTRSHGETDEEILQNTSGDRYVEKLAETDGSLVMLSVSDGISHVIALNKLTGELHDDAIELK